MSPGIPMGSSDRRRHLIAGLIGDSHTFEFNNSASFRAQIEMLANVLPLWVGAMAEESRKSDAALSRLLAEQMIRVPIAPACLCGHGRIRHTGDNRCLDCVMAHPFVPRWMLEQCAQHVPESVAAKCGVPTVERCLKESGHNAAGDGHVAIHGDQWVSWA